MAFIINHNIELDQNHNLLTLQDFIVTVFEGLPLWLPIA